MKLCHWLAFIPFVFAATQVCANSTQDIDALRKYVLEHTENHYRNAYGDAKFDQSVQINVGAIDRRLRLGACDDKLTFKIQEPPHNARNITVKTVCNDTRRWTVYVPATIDIYERVLVVNRSIDRGEVLARQDLDFRRVNIATAGRGHIMDLERAEGMQLKRPLKPGETLRLNHLKKPNIVLKGQTVIVSSRSRFLTVESSGIALVNGTMGQQIKVKNDRSNRVVSAMVVAPGRVSVATR